MNSFTQRDEIHKATRGGTYAIGMREESGARFGQEEERMVSCPNQNLLKKGKPTMPHCN